MMSRAQVREQQDRYLRLWPEVNWRLRHIPAVRSIGVGAKEIGGEVTHDLAFRVYVDVKLPRAEVPTASRIPERIKGLRTDVLQRSKPEPIVDPSKHRPLKGGAQLKNEFVEGDNALLAGTLGCLVQLDIVTRDVMGLTCQHGLLAGQAIHGSKVGQPRYVVSCCCCTYNQIGTIYNSQKDDKVDCAVVRLDADIVSEVNTGSTLNEILQIGTLTGVANPVCFENVRKRGRTTDLTTGRVVDVLFEGSQIVVHPTGTPEFAKAGDSGSVIVNGSGQVIGLLWATDAATRTKGIANHIGEVMRAMTILIAGQSHAGLTLPSTTCASSSV
jgi:hypothetical protein